MNVNPYVLITVIVFIIIIICVIIFITSLKYQPKKIEPIQYSESGLYQPCVISRDSDYTSAYPNSYTSQLCAEGLICEISPGNTVGVCRKAEGSSCSTLLECVSNMKVCYQNVCAQDYTGGLNQQSNPDGSCNENLINVDGYCKVPLNGKCNTDNDCGEGQCLVTDFVYPNDKICVIGRNNTESCSFSDQCASKFCDFSNIEGICQPTNIHTGDYRSNCKYFKSEDQNTACGDKLSCSYDIILQNDNIGICLDTNYLWPNNGTEIECSDTIGACINPTICANGKCIFPPNNLLSCSQSDSSGYCIQNFSCINNLCVPNTGQPAISNNWALVQWKRSINNNMGNWVNIANLSEPGIQPILSTLDTSTGFLAIYAQDISIHTSTFWNYKYIKNGEILNLNLSFNIPTDWNRTNPIFIPKSIRFIPTNTSTLIGLLINIENTSWVLTSNIPVDNNITFTLPPRSSINLGTSLTVFDFQMILKESVNVTPKIIYKNNSNNYYGEVISIEESYNISTVDIFGPILFQLLDLSSFIDIVSLVNGRLDIQFINRITGIPNITYFNTSLATSTSANLEILYLTNINEKYYIGYTYGNNDVILPADFNINSIPSISILDSSLSGSSRSTSLTILTTVV